MEGLKKITLQGKIPRFYVPFSHRAVEQGIAVYNAVTTVAAYDNPTEYRNVYMTGHINLDYQDVRQVKENSQLQLWSL